MIRIFDPRDKMSRYWRLNKGSYIIGRVPDCDLFIDDDTISRKHARIEIEDTDNASIIDLGSRNGTVVNGRLISKETPLSDNDSIELGKVSLKIVISASGSGSGDSIDLIDNFVHSDVTLVPMERAVRQFSSGAIENPDIFNAFFEFGKMLVVPGDNDKILNDGLSQLKKVITFERAAVFNLDEEGGKISLAACQTASKSYSGSFSLSRTILSNLLEKKDAVLIGDARLDDKYAEQKSIVDAGIKSAMAVPLYDEGKVFGVLYADSSNPLNRYTENHLRIFATFGNMLASKISNNVLLNERRAKEILEAELAVASEIQKRLLPRSIPNVGEYGIFAYQNQCTQVGGDLYDISNLSDGRFLVLLADVSGKGMGAALLASNILASFRALYKTDNFDILEATRAVSRQLSDYSRAGDFATLFVAVLDTGTGELRYINAGHNAPLLVSKEGKIEYLEASGIPVGIMNSDSWEIEKKTLNPGDLLFIFTDGIPEALDSNGEQFGDERLEELLLDNCLKSADLLAETVMREVEEFTSDNPRSDDITLIALRRNSDRGI